MSTPQIIIIAAPSGGGKGTLVAGIRPHFPELALTVSATTRPPRAGEEEGKDYYFLSRPDFEKKIAEGAFAEWAEVHGNLYGTLNEEVDRLLMAGHPVLLELDVQGMDSMKIRHPELTGIFIVPPSMEVLRERLKRRGTDSDEGIAVRLQTAAREMTRQQDFDHILINDDLEEATEALRKLVEKILRQS
ncbi:MAG: guanylate kinase [Candidatus Hydrogenedens sp.]|jgi:guanylate kinase|nr:guanylate kinase [Candidatus Hydrogenedens sp.]